MQTLAILALALSAGFAPDEAGSPPAAPRVAPAALQRLAVVGASLSDGYQVRHDLAAVLDALVRAPHGPVTKSATLFFFANPLETGPGELELVSFEDPTALVAVDFLFWYGYGTVNAEGKAIVSEAERLILLEKGLALLDDFECPVVVGDFPDMSDSIGKMLIEAQVPAPETLERLNARLHAWAAEREHVAVVPLARTVETLRAGEPFTIEGLAYPAGSTARLLQADLLHPTQEGMVVIARLVARALVELGVAADADFHHDVPSVLAALDAR